MQKKIRVKNVLILIVLFVFVAMFMIPLIKQGIMCNDELQLRLLRKSGLFEFIRENIEVSASKGRFLSAIIHTKILSYVSGSNMYISRTVDCILIFVTVLAAIYLIYNVTKEKYFSYFVGILLLALLPITYEHTLPNAFISVMCIPMTLLFMSLALLIKAVSEQNKKKNFAISMGLLFIALVKYEFVITYAPIYWIIIYVYTKRKDENLIQHVKRVWKDYLKPFLVCVGYLIMYFGSGKIFSSGYSGNSFGFESVKESLKIIIQLLKSAIPGYYYFNSKYRYLMIVDNGKITAENIRDARFLIMLLTFVILVGFVFLCGKKFRVSHLNKFWKRGILLVVGLLAMGLPTLPLSVSAGYQGVVNEEQFIALPVTFCIYFAAVFVIALVAWEMITKMKYAGMVVVMVALCMVFTQTQIMNNAFSEKQHEAFELLESKEKVFETDVLKDLGIEKLYAKDLFTQHRTLAFHDSYWTAYAKLVGHNMSVIRDVGTESDWRMYSDEDEILSLTNGSVLYVFTDKLMEGQYLIQIGEEYEIEVTLSDGKKDNEKYVYIIELKNLVSNNE